MAWRISIFLKRLSAFTHSLISGCREYHFSLINITHIHLCCCCDLLIPLNISAVSAKVIATSWSPLERCSFLATFCFNINLIFKKNWRIIALQSCVGFCYTMVWISYKIYICVCVCMCVCILGKVLGEKLSYHLTITRDRRPFFLYFASCQLLYGHRESCQNHRCPWLAMTWLNEITFFKVPRDSGITVSSHVHLYYECTLNRG